MSKNVNKNRMTAFPIQSNVMYQGMQLRDFFAAMAMSTLCVNTGLDYEAVATSAYRLADAMMEERDIEKD